MSITRRTKETRKHEARKPDNSRTDMETEDTKKRTEKMHLISRTSSFPDCSFLSRNTALPLHQVERAILILYRSRVEALRDAVRDAKFDANLETTCMWMRLSPGLKTGVTSVAAETTQLLIPPDLSLLHQSGTSDARSNPSLSHLLVRWL